MFADRLACFKCSQDPENRKYQIPEEFFLIIETSYEPKHEFNVKKALASDDSYEEFVSKLLALASSSKKEEEARAQFLSQVFALTHSSDQSEDEDEASREKRRSASVSLPITMNEENFLCGGLTDMLEKTDDGWALVQDDKVQRVVFVPSKSRSDSRSSCLQQIARALGESSRCILVVPLAELDDYVATHSKDWLVVAPCDTTHDTIGDARRCVMTIARSMGLKRIWMIDDSVPAETIYRSEQQREKYPRTGGGRQEPQAKRRPSHLVPFNDALAEVEAFAVRCLKAGYHLALVGLTSTRSMENANNSNPQINQRTPTSFVYLLLDQLPAGVTYDRRLPYKEDVIFAGQIVKEGAYVCIYRGLHFKDSYLAGGCRMYHGK